MAVSTTAGWSEPGRCRQTSGAVFEPPAFVAGLHDLAMVSKAVEEGCGHLGVAKDAGPFGEVEVVVTMMDVRS
jgi:hypothetical protein